ncbi:unnamed protein product [Adineta steineri]|uniref:Uncharacterized protein n=2 Tax=Adineta steineri TaxID=433720 RepID=A0A818HFU4_9BILA|nr:unnamed protein product [Adineta steineri]CAF3508000.1 unnamed protein product [Adineta steineri]
MSHSEILSFVQFIHYFTICIFLTFNITNVLSVYEVGVDYHAFGTNFTKTAFLTQYHISNVRSIVLVQLQGIADRGANFVTLDIWFGSEPGKITDEHWLATFPMSAQETTNLNQYAADVASIQSKIDGHRLHLNIALFWLGIADYKIGNITEGFGSDYLNASEFTSRIEKTTDCIITAISNIRCSDGTLLVQTVYLEAEVMIGAKPNQDWFISTHYPRFLNQITIAGFTPAIYFLVDAREEYILEKDYIDPQYPALNGHRCMYWVYRSLNFLKIHQLPFPRRIDFSCYIDRNTSTYANLTNHILNDADAALSVLGAPKSYGIAETYYFIDDTQRKQFGQAFALEALSNPRLSHLRFWTTPDAGGKGIHIAYPFAIEDFLPPLKKISMN